MGAAVQLVTNFETTGACPTCGIDIAVPRNWLRVKKEEGGKVYCPNGHSFSYTVTAVQQLTKELESQKQATEFQRNQRLLAERTAARAKGEVTRIKNRVGNGVCPCCKRTFQNVMSHMKTKHPTYKSEGAEE